MYPHTLYDPICLPRMKGAGAGVTATQPRAAILSDTADRWLKKSDLLFFSLMILFQMKTISMITITLIFEGFSLEDCYL